MKSFPTAPRVLLRESITGVKKFPTAPREVIRKVGAKKRSATPGVLPRRSARVKAAVARVLNFFS